jgi:hypothetical protein
MSGALSNIVSTVKNKVANKYNLYVTTKRIVGTYGASEMFRTSAPYLDSYGNLYRVTYSWSDYSNNIFYITKTDAKNKKTVWVKKIEGGVYLNIPNGGFSRLYIEGYYIYLFMFTPGYIAVFDLDGNYVKTLINYSQNSVSAVIGKYLFTLESITIGTSSYYQNKTTYYTDYYDYKLRATNLGTGASVAVGGPILSGTVDASPEAIRLDSSNNCYYSRHLGSTNHTEIQTSNMISGTSVYSYRTLTTEGGVAVSFTYLKDMVIGASNKIYILQTLNKAGVNYLRLLVSNSPSDLSTLYAKTTTPVPIQANTQLSTAFLSIDSKEEYAYVTTSTYYYGNPYYYTIRITKINLKDGTTVWTNSLAPITDATYDYFNIYGPPTLVENLNQLSICFLARRRLPPPNSTYENFYGSIDIPTDGTTLGTITATTPNLTYTADNNYYTYTKSTYSAPNTVMSLYTTTTKVNYGQALQSTNTAGLITMSGVNESSYNAQNIESVTTIYENK